MQWSWLLLCRNAWRKQQNIKVKITIMEKSHLKLQLLFMLTKCTHQNNLKKSYTEKKKADHTPSGYSLFTNCSFDTAKNKLASYLGKDCMERFCKDLREHTIKIIYCRSNLVLMKTIKMHLKPEIIVITLKNIKGPLIVFVI